MGSDYGPWEPLRLAKVLEVFRLAPFRWWLSGGLAFELHLGRSWRTHDDIDVSFCRDDAPLVRGLLSGWDIHLAAAGVLTPWDGGRLLPDAHQNNLWCKRVADGPWCLDLTVSDGDDESWIFRRDPSVTVAWGDAVLTTADGIPYLAPELQLLFKARDPRPKDDVDAAVVIPLLEPSRAAFLSSILDAAHRWRAYLEA